MLTLHWNNIDIMSFQRWNNVETILCNVEKPLYQCRQLCFNIVLSSNNDIISKFCKVESPTSDLLYFQRRINVSSTLVQHWSTNLKERWSSVEMLARHQLWISVETMLLLKFRQRCSSVDNWSELKFSQRMFVDVVSMLAKQLASLAKWLSVRLRTKWL